MSKNNQDKVFDDADIEQLTKDFEFALENEQHKVLPTRASVKRQFVNLSPQVMLEVSEALETLNDNIGITDTSPRTLFQHEIDNLVEELLAVRKASDILSSREGTLKTFAKDVISLTQISPSTTSGSLNSPKHKLRISKEIRGGKATIQIDRLKKRLTPEQFKSVTNMITTIVETTTPDGKMDEVITVTYEVNEKFLEAEMVKGNILSEDIYLSTIESTKTSAIYLRDLED